MKKLEKNQIEALIDQAIGMMDYSYAPYSHFHVGAALLSQKRKSYTAAATLRMQPTPQATAQNALRFLKQSAKACWNLMPSA